MANWNISLRQYSVLMDFHTSVSRISAESWLMESQPRLSSIFLTLSLFMRLEPHKSLSMSLKTILMPLMQVGVGSVGLILTGQKMLRP